ncbi:hypothetical protein D3P04_02425 [Paracoccus onubensis]|uniref:Uncharacterized protein n=1 Tax=Paracoccus onubensis TaxID=1675788 RepID=A0A418T8F2_9RHOB|nr:hypothetical protein D3P04_02425 [Paracoccus onubensis]
MILDHLSGGFHDPDSACHLPAGFAAPATIAGYALVHGIAKNLIGAGLAVILLGGIGGLVIGISAIAPLNVLGEWVLSD